jgi:hypothetical protein
VRSDGQGREKKREEGGMAVSLVGVAMGKR